MQSASKSLCRLMSAPGLGCVKTLYRKCRRVAILAKWRFGGIALGSTIPSCRRERLNAHDVNDPREVVGQDVQCHLGGNP
jgi:hypothetical protein